MFFRQITASVTFLPLLDCLCSFDILIYTHRLGSFLIFCQFWWFKGTQLCPWSGVRVTPATLQTRRWNQINYWQIFKIKKNLHECRRLSCGHSALLFTRLRQQSAIKQRCENFPATKPKCDTSLLLQIRNDIYGLSYPASRVMMLLFKIDEIFRNLCKEGHISFIDCVVNLNFVRHSVNHTFLVKCPQDIHS